MILVNGCSFCQGQNAWPNHLKTIDQQNVVNLSCSSAGNTYIHEATIKTLSQMSFEMVLIMWSGLSRVDIKVENIDQFNGSWYTSKFASRHNDWPSKIVLPINDQDFVDNDWVFGLGEQNKDAVVSRSKLFNGIYKHLNIQQFIFHFLIKLISLQNTLKILNLPYIFMFYQPYQSQLTIFPELCKLIDWDNVYLEKNIWKIATDNNDLDSTGHPQISTHKKWAMVMDELISKKLMKDSHA